MNTLITKIMDRNISVQLENTNKKASSKYGEITKSENNNGL